MDSDQTFPPGALERLMSWDKEIVAGLVFQRTGAPVPMFYKYSHLEDKGHWYEPLIQTIGDYLVQHRDLWPQAKKGAILLPPGPGLLELDGVSAGCLLVHRRVFEAIEEPWFKWNEEWHAGEDFYFCRKAQQAGFKIWGDPSVVCGHITEYRRSIQHFMAWSEKTEFPWEETKDDKTSTN